MGQYQTEAILLAARDWNDADRMVTLFSREYGKITAAAYGARHPKNRMSGNIQVFTHADLSLLPGKNLETIKQCEVKYSFREIREDLAFMAYGSFISELVIELWPERVAEPAVFDMMLGAFGLFNKRNPRIVSLACAWQLLSLAGYYPAYRECLICGQTIEFPAYFDIEAGGCICRSCVSQQQRFYEFSNDIGLFLERLLHLDWQEPARFTVNGAVLIQTEKILAAFIKNRLEKPLKSLAFISSLNL